MSRSRPLAALLCAITVACGDERPNLVLISMDTLTLLDALGVPIPDAVQGESSMPLVRGEPFAPTRPRLVVVGDDSTVRFDTRLEIAFRAVDGGIADRQVFDLASDPGETDDLHDAPGGPARFEEAYARYEVWRTAQALDDVRFASTLSRGESSAEAQAELSALGCAEE